MATPDMGAPVTVTLPARAWQNLTDCVYFAAEISDRASLADEWSDTEINTSGDSARQIRDAVDRTLGAGQDRNGETVEQYVRRAVTSDAREAARQMLHEDLPTTEQITDNAWILAGVVEDIARRLDRGDAS